MKAVNLYVLTRAGSAMFRETFNALSDNQEMIKNHEYNDLRGLVDGIDGVDDAAWMCEGFWYSYRIPHISKEFDLLKLEPGRLIVNIELKSQDVGRERICAQLKQNRSYLAHFNTRTECFTYVSELDAVFRLDGEELAESTFAELVRTLRGFDGAHIYENLDMYFKPANYLVAPLTQPEKLLNGEYFLTGQQLNFKSDILKRMEEECAVYGITGEPGTGKTLLLYDMAMELSNRGKCCVVHGTNLSEGHLYIDKRLDRLDILGPADVSAQKLSEYDYILIDELQRIYDGVTNVLHGFIGKKPVIVSYDEEQVLSQAEDGRRIGLRIRSLPGYEEFKLTNSLRINKQIAAFYKMMFNMSAKPKGPVDFDCVDVVYASSMEEALRIMGLYCSGRDYRLIYCEESSDCTNYAAMGVSSLSVIGQEFDNVITVMDEHFSYDGDGVLKGSVTQHDFIKMLYQNVTRTRDRLCILVYKNPDLYCELLKIKELG
ncbi:MAG: ATP-binding protein [Lachnospiraceae bacterium]|nr:ATP-binding protein [Lachnospiraceae bacterium]